MYIHDRVSDHIPAAAWNPKGINLNLFFKRNARYEAS